MHAIRQSALRGLLLMLFSAGAWAVQTVPLYTYYTSPPFAVEGVAPSGSYTVQLAQWLTQQSAGRYQFEALQLPRPRLQLQLNNSDWQGVVAWANPQWFDDVAQQRYLWSGPLMEDADVLVFHQAEALPFGPQGPTRPLRFGGLSGHVYAPLQRFFDSGLLQREDAQNELSSLRKLQHQRVDVVLLGASALPYMREQLPDFDQWATVYTDPHLLAPYPRYLFTNRNNPELRAFLDQALRQLRHAPEWQEALHPLAQ